VGFTGDIDYRFNQHLVGEGSITTKKAIQQGYNLVLAEIWTNTTTVFEQYVQKQFTCPECGQIGSMNTLGNPRKKPKKSSGKWEITLRKVV
jgi:hypothetical protein